MAEPFTMDAGARYAFPPSPELIEGVVHRIRIVFQASDGRVWTAGADDRERRGLLRSAECASCSGP